MKPAQLILLGVLSCFAAYGAAFQNLGFEEAVKADIPRYGSGFGGVAHMSSLVPGWHGSGTAVRYNVIPGQLDSLGLFDNRAVDIAHYPIVGEFAVAAFAGGIGYELRQTGDVPSDARTLRFMFDGAYLTVSINGKPLSIERQGLFDSGNPSVPKLQYYGADVAEYAGKEVTLSFSFSSPPQYYFHPQVLDDVSFSKLKLIPEPSVGVLFVFGSGLFLVCLRREGWDYRIASKK